MKKLVAFAMAAVFVCNMLPVASAAVDDHHKKKTHKVHTKSHTKAHKLHTKSTHKLHIKAMPKTGMGGASD